MPNRIERGANNPQPTPENLGFGTELRLRAQAAGLLFYHSLHHPRTSQWLIIDKKAQAVRLEPMTPEEIAESKNISLSLRFRAAGVLFVECFKPPFGEPFDIVMDGTNNTVRVEHPSKDSQ